MATTMGACGLPGDPGVPNSWCWPNQNSSVQEHPNAPLQPPSTFEGRGPVREGLCPAEDVDHHGGDATNAGTGCPATDYAACTCKYNGTVPNNRDQPLLFDLRHDPVRCRVARPIAKMCNSFFGCLARALRVEAACGRAAAGRAATSVRTCVVPCVAVGSASPFVERSPHQRHAFYT